MILAKKHLRSVFILFMVVINIQEHVEGVENLRKLGVTFHLESAEKTYEDLFENFKEKIRLDQERKEIQEMEKRRNEIFRKFLLSRVHGPVLKDFYSRF